MAIQNTLKTHFLNIFWNHKRNFHNNLKKKALEQHAGSQNQQLKFKVLMNTSIKADAL